MTRFAFFFVLVSACDCGATTPSRPCMTDSECTGDELCIDSVCLQSGCTADDECAVGETCLDTLCVPGGEMCMVEGDCPSGQICVGEQCQAAICVDPDMDGYGPGCSRGEDCDNDDAIQTGSEVCDGVDNDCDGVADNGVLSECGDCDLDCRAGTIGPGGDGFMPDDMNSDGVGVADDGALELDARRINTNFIWIANTTEGSVSRYSTMPPFNEVGRYFVGAAIGAGAFNQGNDPSRTSVNAAGDAFVGNRHGNELTRISVLGNDCPDTNGDGAVTSSSDLNGDGLISTALADGEMMAWGEDDCILWHTELDAAFAGEVHVRAVAAQDVEGPDGELQEYVWVGGYDTSRAAKIDAETGNVIFATASPTPTYGFALDGMGRLWVSGRGATRLGMIDTTRCVDQASCDAAEICVAPTIDDTSCDGAIKASWPLAHRPYGVTVDFNQRVWIGGDTSAPGARNYIPHYTRFDPAAVGTRSVTVNLSTATDVSGATVDFDHVVNGIAADAEGFVWGAGFMGGMIRIDADDPTQFYGVPGSGSASMRVKGMAIDAEGKIWGVTMNDQSVVVTPGPGLMDNAVETGVASAARGSYTYSDMTGLQLRLATNPRGYYRHIFEGCPESVATDWGRVQFDAETPAGTSVTFRVRTAATREGLDAAEWVAVGVTPPDSSPLDIAGALMDAGVTPERFLMLELVLNAERMSTSEIITPRVLSVDVTHSCPPILG